ncbi:hypothetical protein [Mycolicibacterium nivoides]|uniref:hypothetical protein n=1 Tax=Mycolicibacterium nivoides TaxID=2487344 RepID=UPI003B967A4B
MAGDGHAVLALARSATSADKARDLGAAPLLAELGYFDRTSRAEGLKQMQCTAKDPVAPAGTPAAGSRRAY